MDRITIINFYSFFDYFQIEFIPICTKIKRCNFEKKLIKWNETLKIIKSLPNAIINNLKRAQTCSNVTSQFVFFCLMSQQLTLTARWTQPSISLFWLHRTEPNSNFLELTEFDFEIPGNSYELLLAFGIEVCWFSVFFFSSVDKNTTIMVNIIFLLSAQFFIILINNLVQN